MAITLVTGLPGHGKTLYTLARWKAEAAKESRPVFHNAIKGLKIPNWQPWEVKDWQNLPAGAIFVIDEAQFAFPVRGRGAPDDWVQRLATHRHLGIDIVVITQDPMLLDSFVRRLVDRHFHIVRRFGMQNAVVHEFPNGAREVVAKSREGSIRSEFVYPKDVFEMYESAELHTVKRRLPLRFWVMLAAPVVFTVFAAIAYTRLNPDAQAARLKENVAHATGVPIGSAATSGLPGRNAEPSILSPVEYAERYSPRIVGLPHTAPVFDKVTEPVIAPFPSACLASREKCVCYSQQATRLSVPESLCRDIAAGGFFVPWTQTREPVRVAAGAESPSPLKTH